MKVEVWKNKSDLKEVNVIVRYATHARHLA